MVATARNDHLSPHEKQRAAKAVLEKIVTEAPRVPQPSLSAGQKSVWKDKYWAPA